MVVGETGSEVEVEAVPAKKVKKGGRLVRLKPSSNNLARSPCRFGRASTRAH
jgi:hypothetical protein